MPHFTFKQALLQLEKQRGGYFYLWVEDKVVEQFEKGRATRLVCVLDGKLSYSCGLNHTGDGHYFIIVSTARVKKLGLVLGQEVQFEIYEDPNPLGVEIPEVLSVFLEQDPEGKAVFEKMTDGKKRSLIYSIKPIKDIDKQVEKIQVFLEEEDRKWKAKEKRR